MTAPEKPDYKKKNYIFDKENRCWAVEDETAYSGLITYKFPEDAGCTPFSSNPYYHYFIEAAGLTYLGDYEDFRCPYGNEKVQKAIPMGYKAILIYERVCLYEKGKIIFERSLPEIRDTKDRYVGKYVVLSSKPQRYEIPSWGDHELVTCEVKVTVENKLYIDASEDLNAAQKIAREYSLKDNSRCIVCRIIEYVNWH